MTTLTKPIQVVCWGETNSKHTYLNQLERLISLWLVLNNHKHSITTEYLLSSWNIFLSKTTPLHAYNV